MVCAASAVFSVVHTAVVVSAAAAVVVCGGAVVVVVGASQAWMATHTSLGLRLSLTRTSMMAGSWDSTRALQVAWKGVEGGRWEDGGRGREEGGGNTESRMVRRCTQLSKFYFPVDRVLGH